MGSESLVIRHASPDDVPMIARVHVEVSQATYAQIFPPEHLATMTYERREAAWRKILANKESSTLVAAVNESVVGFSNGGTRRQGPPSYTGEIYSLYVLPGHHRRGIGRLLVAELTQALAAEGHRSILVWVLEDNPACFFYERLGGVRVDSSTITRAGKQLQEVAYGWPDIATLAHVAHH